MDVYNELPGARMCSVLVYGGVVTVLRFVTLLVFCRGEIGAPHLQ